MRVNLGIVPPKVVPITVWPLQPAIAVEIEGVDLRTALPTDQRDAIKAVVLKYKVVFFRDQQITRTQQADFAWQFGRLYEHPSTNPAEQDKLAAIHHLVPHDK